jgi:hypothetical protein
VITVDELRAAPSSEASAAPRTWTAREASAST